MNKLKRLLIIILENLGHWTDESNDKSIDYCICSQAKDYGYVKSDFKEVEKLKDSKLM